MKTFVVNTKRAALGWPSKVWLKSKNPASDAVRREREERVR